MAEGEICVPKEILNSRPTVQELTRYATDGFDAYVIGSLLGLADVQKQRFARIIKEHSAWSID